MKSIQKGIITGAAAILCYLFLVTRSSADEPAATERAMRVLYLEGKPRWEYRYLKNALIRDRALEAQIYLFGADADFIQESSPGAPSLKEPPGTLAALSRYDAIILGDVPDAALEAGDPPLARLLVEYVTAGGGGLLALAGEKFPANSAIAEVLPVKLAGGGEAHRAPTPRVPRLTEKGRESAALQLADDPAESLEIWEKRLPGFYGFRRDAEARLDAEVLAVIEDADAKKEIPLYALGKFGAGRTFFAGSDETWRWRAGADDLYFHRFWKRAIHSVASR